MRYRNIIQKVALTTAAIFLLSAAGDAVYSQNLMPPTNDMFGDAQLIEGSSGFINGSTLTASSEPNEPMYYNGSETVWYKWQASAGVSITFDLRTLDESTAGIAIYHGDFIQKLSPIGYGLHFDRVTFIAQPKVEYMIQICTKESAKTGAFELSWAINGAETWKQFNFDGQQAFAYGAPSGKSDFAIFRWQGLPKDTSQWWIFNSNLRIPSVYEFTNHFLAPEHLAPGDYDGDGRVDIGVYHKQDTTFWIFRSGTNTAMVLRWGLSEDNPVQGDFDGDDMADFAIFRPSEGTFWILKSTDGQPLAVRWGMNGDEPVCGDYDGDGITDLAVKRGPGADRAVYYFLRSSDQQVQIFSFGFGHDFVVPGDYDGDGKSDLAVFRHTNSTFYFVGSTTGEVYTVDTGLGHLENGDRAVPGDYFGDARSDMCVWLFRTGDFKCAVDGQPGYIETFHWGMQGDEPVAFSNVH